jgi:electron transfer flavoprotein beta subunit
MNVFVLLKMAPDTVEELNVASDGKSLDSDYLRFKLSDPDEHALEQALLLKERGGGSVTVVALDSPEVDEALYTALAKGADRAVKLASPVTNVQSLAAAKLFASWLKGEGQALPADTLILLRSQSIDDLEGEIGPFLAELLGLSYACVVTSVRPEGDGLLVIKEFADGLRGEFSLPLPAVLGIQSAEKPPRYVPIAKVRAVMKSAKIETVEVTPPETLAAFPVERMYKPEAAGRAQMLEGAPEEAADKIIEVLAKTSLI